MPRAVGDVAYEAQILAVLSSEQMVNGFDQNLYDVYVLPLVETADVVGLGDFSIMEYGVDGPGMVLHE